MVNSLKVIIVAIAVFGLATLAMAQTAVTTDSIASGGAAIDENNGWNSLAVDSSGNIFAVGTTSISATESHIMIAEFTSAGKLVAGFGTGGIVIMASLSGGKLDQGNGIAVDSSDNVYIVGTADAGGSNASKSDIVVAKFSSAGVITAWGSGSGQGTGTGADSFDSVDISANAGGDDFGFGIALTAPTSPTTTKIVVVGQSNGPFAAGGGTGGAKSDIVVLQLLNAGTLDPGFGGGGVGGKVGSLLTNASNQAAGAETATDKGMDVVLDSSGSIYVLDSSSSKGINVFKITPAGALQTDATGGFGNLDWDADADNVLTEGVARYLGISPAVGARITLDSSGNVYVVGTDNKKLLLVRFTSKGVLDSTFGNVGVVTSQPSATAEGFGVSIQTGGNIFVSGNSFNGHDVDSLVVEYTSSGSILTGFGSSGISLYTTPTSADQGAKSAISVTTTINPLVNTRTGIAAFGTSSVFAVGGVDTQTATKADGLLLLYSLTTSTGAFVPPFVDVGGSSGGGLGGGGGCGAVGLDALALLGIAYLLKRKKAVIGRGLSMRSVFRKSMVVVMILCVQAVGICQEQDKDKQSQENKIEELQKQMQDMQKELMELRKQLSEQKTQGNVPGEKGTELQRQIDQLKRQLEQDKKEEDKGAIPLRAYWENESSSNKGLWIKSPDNNFSLRIGGYLQTDAHIFAMQGLPGAKAGVPSTSSTFLMRRVRPEFMGTIYKYFSYDLMADFGKSSYTAAGTAVAQLIDAWLNFKLKDEFQIKVGKLKVPISMESLISDKFLPTIEYSYAFRNLDPDREIGAMIWGNVWGGKLQYNLGVFNGSTQGTNDSLSGIGDLANQNGKEFVARLWAQPFKCDSNEWLKGLQFGISASDMRQNNADLSGTKFTTDANTAFFTFAGATGSGTVLGNGSRTRVSPQLAYMVGSFGLEAEYNSVVDNMQLALPALGPLDKYTFNAGYVTLSYFLTGENALDSMYRKKVLKPFDLDKGQWGALELLTRLQYQSGGGTLIPNKMGTGSQDSRGVLIGFNWYPVNDVKVGLDYTRSNFGNGVTIGGQTFNHESTILLRFQIEF